VGPGGEPERSSRITPCALPSTHSRTLCIRKIRDCQSPRFALPVTRQSVPAPSFKVLECSFIPVYTRPQPYGQPPSGY